jgi:hypothetical protein
MPGLDAARLRALADELDAEETATRRELEDAETRSERERLQATIDELQAKQAKLEERLAARDEPPPPAPHDDDDDEVEETTAAKPQTRKGRKRGQLYQDKPGEPGYVYQGEDEPDIVQLDTDDEQVA